MILSYLNKLNEIDKNMDIKLFANFRSFAHVFYFPLIFQHITISDGIIFYSYEFSEAEFCEVDLRRSRDSAKPNFGEAEIP